MQRLHDKVSGNLQKFTTMVYEINKSRDLKKRTGNHIWKKVFESMIMTEKRIPWYMHIIFLTKILGIFAVSWNPIIIRNWIKKNAGKVPTNLLKQKRSTEGYSKFKSPETRQVQERLVSTLEHMQVPTWDRTRVRRSKRPLLACRTRCICSMETLHN